MKTLSDFSPNLGGLDIGISPAAPAVGRGHPGKWTRCLGRGCWMGLPYLRHGRSGRTSSRRKPSFSSTSISMCCGMRRNLNQRQTVDLGLFSAFATSIWAISNSFMAHSFTR